MPFGDVLVHRGVVLRMEPVGEWVAGSREEQEVEGPHFDCAFFPPGARETGPRARVSAAPLLLISPTDHLGAPLNLAAGDRVRISGPGLALIWLGEWMLDGPPQEFGRPGAAPVGYQATLKRVTD